MNKIRWFAHRALGSNKLKDILHSCKTNAYGIELDVQYYNNKLVLCHDLIRPGLNVGCVYPLLSDAFDIIKENGFDKSVLLDIKGINKDINIALELEKAINDSSIPNDKILISSFNESYLTEIHSVLPNQKLGYITCNIPYANFDFVPSYISFLSLDYNTIDENVIRMVKSKNREVFVWTIKENNFIKLKGIDYVISDVKL